MDEEQIRIELKKLLAEQRKLKQNIRCQKYRAKMLKVPGWIEKEKERHHNDYMNHRKVRLAKAVIWQGNNRKRVNEIHRRSYNKKAGKPYWT